MRKYTRAGWINKSAAGLLGVAAVGFLAGRLVPTPSLQAGPPEVKPAMATATTNDPSKQVIAYLHGGKVPITRGDLGEYLIARMNPEKIELLVNKMIIETACKERNIIVTPAEIETVFQDDLRGIAVNRKQFIDTVLKQYGKTEYEWKEDVLKPRLQLAKLCQLNVQVSDDEIRQAFESEFGPRVEGRIIIWPKTEKRIATKQWEEIRGNDDKFDEAARQQPVSSLAAIGGRIKPFGRGAGTHENLEKVAFQLKPNEISPILETNEGYVCFKLDKQIPADDKVKFEDHRERFSKIVYEKKVAQAIPQHFKILRDAANPVVLFGKKETGADVEKIMDNIMQTGASAPSAPTPAKK